MGLKHVLRSVALFAVVMTMGLMATPARADVWTDQTVYHAGDTVSISGDGMQAGESVGVEVFLPDGTLDQHHDVLADDQGNFSDSYTLALDAQSGDYTVVATGTESGQAYTTTFDPIGAGALDCPSLQVHNPTHYKLQVGTTVTCTIDGASEVSGQTSTTVFIKSSTLGNTQVTGTVTGTGSATQITFTFTAPPDGCDTTVVAYDKVGTNSNNTIISGDPNSPSAAGFAYVDGNGNVIECGGGGTPSVSILKVADAPIVTAGEAIGFTITVSSDGTATAEGVQVTDPLPTDAGTSWSIDGGTGAAYCSISAGVLSCNFGNMAAASSFTVHITSPTTKATVANSPVVNTATVTSTNAGSGESTDQVVVVCPRISVTVRPDAASVSVGGAAGFTITVSRTFNSVVHSVTLTNLLPTGLSWTVNGGTGSNMCSISGSTLSCSFGDMGLGAKYTVHVSASTVHTGTLSDRAQAKATNPLSVGSGKGSTLVI